MSETIKANDKQNPISIRQVPKELADIYKDKLHTAIESDPKTNYFKEILASGDVEAAREIIAHLMKMEESPWGQTEDDDRTQADIYSSHLRIWKMMKLVRQAKVTSDGKTPSDIEIAKMLIGVSEPKEDLETLSRLHDILKENHLTKSISNIVGGVKERIRQALSPDLQKV